jgi:hypothetical protein
MSSDVKQAAIEYFAWCEIDSLAVCADVSDKIASRALLVEGAREALRTTLGSDARFSDEALIERINETRERGNLGPREAEEMIEAIWGGAD